MSPRLAIALTILALFAIAVVLAAVWLVLRAGAHQAEPDSQDDPRLASFRDTTIVPREGE